MKEAVLRSNKDSVTFGHSSPPPPASSLVTVSGGPAMSHGGYSGGFSHGFLNVASPSPTFAFNAAALAGGKK